MRALIVWPSGPTLSSSLIPRNLHECERAVEVASKGIVVYALQERLHHIAHLDEEHADLLVVVPALHVELDYDAEGAHGNYKFEHA